MLPFTLTSPPWGTLWGSAFGVCYSQYMAVSFCLSFLISLLLCFCIAFPSDIVPSWTSSLNPPQVAVGRYSSIKFFILFLWPRYFLYCLSYFLYLLLLSFLKCVSTELARCASRGRRQMEWAVSGTGLTLTSSHRGHPCRPTLTCLCLSATKTLPTAPNVLVLNFQKHNFNT